MKQASRSAAALLLLLSSAQARADPIFSYAFDQATYKVTAGSTVDVTVLFQELDNNKSTTGALPNGYLANIGLFGVGVLVDYSGQPAMVSGSSDVTPSAAFVVDPSSGSSITWTNSQTTLVENVGLGPFVTASGSGPAYQIEVGVFRFTGLTPGTATITAGVTGSGDDDLGSDFTVLDGQTGSGTATIEVSGATAVPEPAPVVLLAIGTLLLMGYHCHQRRQAPNCAW